MKIDINNKDSLIQQVKSPKGGRARLNWYQTALNLAFDIAYYRSEDPYTIVGACGIKKGGFDIVLGYNGAPSGIDINWEDRDFKNQRVIHAEENVLNSVLPGEIEFLAITHLPCDRCIRTIKMKKIDTVIYSKIMERYNPGLTFELAKEFKINLFQLDPTTRNL